MNINKTIIGILLIATILTGTGLINALQDPYPMDGYVVDFLGAPVDNADITFTNLNTGDIIYKTTLSDGYYGQDAGNFLSGYQDGDVINYQIEYKGYNTVTSSPVNASKGFQYINITLYIVTDTDNDGVPNAWDKEPDTPTGYMTDSSGYGLLWGDMNRDGKLSSVDALMILQIAVR